MARHLRFIPSSPTSVCSSLSAIDLPKPRRYRRAVTSPLPIPSNLAATNLHHPPIFAASDPRRFHRSPPSIYSIPAAFNILHSLILAAFMPRPLHASPSSDLALRPAPLSVSLWAFQSFAPADVARESGPLLRHRCLIDNVITIAFHSCLHLHHHFYLRRHLPSDLTSSDCSDSFKQSEKAEFAVRASLLWHHKHVSPLPLWSTVPSSSPSAPPSTFVVAREGCVRGPGRFSGTTLIDKAIFIALRLLRP
ncbi:hypothetical protein IWX50DRAFT_485897 [Phyllosticta citricarpa]